VQPCGDRRLSHLESIANEAKYLRMAEPFSADFVRASRIHAGR
jgi:hypothetical protein